MDDMKICLSFLFSCFIFFTAAAQEEKPDPGSPATTEETKEDEKIVDQKNDADKTCSLVSFCMDFYKDDEMALCYQENVDKTSGCEKIDFDGFLKSWEELIRRRTSPGGKESDDFIRMLKVLLESKMANIVTDKLGQKILKIINKATGSVLYSRNLHFSGKRTFTSSSKGMFSYTVLRSFSAIKKPSAAQQKIMLDAIFKNITISLRVK